MVSKNERQRIIDSGSPSAKLSMGQQYLHSARELEKKSFGESKTLSRSKRRKEEQESFLQQRSEMQFSRALGHVIDGKTTLQDLDYIDSFGYVIDEFTGERGSKVIVIIVDFNRGNK